MEQIKGSTDIGRKGLQTIHSCPRFAQIRTPRRAQTNCISMFGGFLLYTHTAQEKQQPQNQRHPRNDTKKKALKKKKEESDTPVCWSLPLPWGHLSATARTC